MPVELAFDLGDSKIANQTRQKSPVRGEKFTLLAATFLLMNLSNDHELQQFLNSRRGLGAVGKIPELNETP